MTLWIVRGDKYGQYQGLASEKGFAYHFSQLPDASAATSREAVIEMGGGKEAGIKVSY